MLKDPHGSRYLMGYNAANRPMASTALLKLKS